MGCNSLFILEQSFFNRDPETVAKDLLGKLIIKYGNPQKIGRVVETEAYLGKKDLACHTAWKPKAAALLDGLPGIFYIYMIYGMYYMTNIVTEKEGSPSAILLRAVEPIRNLDIISGGPGKLSRAFDIDMSYNGKPAFLPPLYFVDDSHKDFKTITSKRIGVNYAGKWADKPLRFFIEGNKFVSK